MAREFNFEIREALSLLATEEYLFYDYADSFLIWIKLIEVGHV
jgi:hypothetical protein